MTIAVKKLDIVRNTTAVDSVSRKDRLYIPFSCQLRFLDTSYAEINQTINQPIQSRTWSEHLCMNYINYM